MNNKIKIVADDKIPFLKGVLEPFCNIEYYPGKEITREKVKDTDVLIVRTRTKCNAELLDGSNIKLITTATIGYDHIDVEYCEQKNIKWLNAPGCNSVSVKQYITAAILYLARKEEFDPAEKTIGIVGVGNVGSKIKEVADILGMRVLLNDPPRERIEGGEPFCSLQKIIEESDIITFHVPLNKDGNDKTYHLADEKFFNSLTQKPIIINSSRGEVIKTSALLDAIKTNKVKNVILDVWESEPDIDLELLELVDVGSPHIAGYSADGKANGTSVCVNAINKYFKFGLKDDWYPNEIPKPLTGDLIKINCKGKNDIEVITEAVNYTYNIVDDYNRLKLSPGTFEQQRGNYPIRREFGNYGIILENERKGINKKLETLGFNIINN